jgi:hypothetical protein
VNETGEALGVVTSSMTTTRCATRCNGCGANHYRVIGFEVRTLPGQRPAAMQSRSSMCACPADGLELQDR